MHTHVQAIFGRKPRRAGVVDVTAQCKRIGHPVTNGQVLGDIQIAEIIASVKNPTFVEIVGYVDQVYDDALYVISIGTTSGGNQIFITTDINTQAVGFTVLKRFWFTAKTKIYMRGNPLGTGYNSGGFRLFITAKGSDSRGN